jgi:hypothetical protein
MPSDDGSSLGQFTFTAVVVAFACAAVFVAFACAAIVVAFASAAVTVVLAFDVVSVLERTIAADAGRGARQFCYRTANDPDAA